MIGKSMVLLTFGICTVTGLRKLEGYLRALNSVDAYLKGSQEQLEKLLGIFLPCVSLSLVVAIGVTIFSTFPGMPYYLVSMAHIVLMSLVTLQYVMLMLELWARFRTLNGHLLESLRSAGDSEMGALLGGTTTPSSQLRLQPTRQRHLRDAYITLTHAADLLQQHFGLPMAVNIATCVCGGACSLYEMIIMVINPHWILQFSVIRSAASSTAWFLFHSFKLVSVALSAAAAADAAAATGVILLRTSVVSGWCDPHDDAFLCLTLQTPPLRFTAAGFFTIDRPLLVSAIAAIVTYVIILVQLTPY
ncbi:uncharacterized protein LOC126335719 [Schistocerca gregaria]|uniref:uncharacterized protein LOC126335719 n=1 Tax=Schistocerca gregaria TaxID=7010 RepID=UPI00211DDCE7|nr:uncharacterized protein LOC126335719 [Schistocerca gregaria]